MNEAEGHIKDCGSPGDSASPVEPYSYGRLATQRTPLGFAARLLKHPDEHDDARRRVQAATKALRESPDEPAARREAEAALAAYRKAEHRLARSRWRMQQSIEQATRMLASGRASAESFVFSTSTGTAISHRNAGRAIKDARDKAGVGNQGDAFHVLRHGFASTLIVDLGLDPVQACRQLGHRHPSITLDTYSHLFDRARHADDVRSRLGASRLAASVVAMQ